MTGAAFHCDYCADEETDAERGLVIAELAAQAAEAKLERVAVYLSEIDHEPGCMDGCETNLIVKELRAILAGAS